MRSRIEEVLALTDAPLISGVGGKEQNAVRRELARFDPSCARREAAQAGVTLLCRCQPDYPGRLRALEAPPAVIHIAGDRQRLLRMLSEEAVALVGSRRGSAYGLGVARSLGQGVSLAGITVISGMALGIDSAAHTGALAAGAGTVAVLPGGAEHSYPVSKRSLHARIRASGAAISELPPGTAVWRWAFLARNRLLAALAAMTIVVEAGERSGALVTARLARSLGRPVGAVPGRVTSPQAAGPNALLAAGAHVVRTPQDVLDVLFGAGVRRAHAAARVDLAPELRVVLGAIADGYDSTQALERAGVSAEQGLAALADLELAGHVRREAGGRFCVTS